MASTTIKLSVATRDRLKQFGGDTYEDTIVEALDALEAERFWAQAEEAAAWRRSQSSERRAEIAARERSIDSDFEGLG